MNEFGWGSSPSLQTDIYGTCTTTYEQRGATLMKTRNLRRCLRERLDDFWWRSVPLNEDRVRTARAPPAGEDVWYGSA